MAEPIKKRRKPRRRKKVVKENIKPINIDNQEIEKVEKKIKTDVKMEPKDIKEEIVNEVPSVEIEEQIDEIKTVNTVQEISPILNDDSVKEEVNKPKKKKNSKLGLIIGIIVVVILGLTICSIYSKDYAVKAFIGNLKRDLKVSDNENYDFEAKITSTSNTKYDILNNAVIKGSYERTNNSFTTDVSFTSKDNNTTKVSLYNDGTNTYYNDSYIFDKALSSSNGTYDLSISGLNKNIINFTSSLLNDVTHEYTTTYFEDGALVIELNITKDNINNIVTNLGKVKLDILYQNYLDKLITDMTDNQDDYIGTELKLYTRLITNSFIKLEIRGKGLTTISKTKEGYYIENIAQNNEVTKLSISSTNINLTELTGSRTDLSLNVDFTLTAKKSSNLTFDKSNSINISSLTETDEFNIKKQLSKDTNRSGLISLYYYITGNIDKLSMHVNDSNYFVYYNVPDGYNTSNYTGSSYKKYIDIDKTIIYSIKGYNNSQMLNYISTEYDKMVSSSFYYNVMKKASESIGNKGLNYNYQIITKTYDSNYADYDTTSSTLYIWYQLNDNTSFLIEYEYQGADITEENIKALLDIQVGNN